MNKQLILGDCIEVLKTLPDNSIDSIVTDPPYGLSFMGVKWDYDIPSVDVWKECWRVLKPGGHLLAFSASRNYHRMGVAIEDAGFEIRDQLQWIYGSGFPKSHNIGHKVEEYKGWGTALKPAHEPIVMARKPLSEKTIVDNVLEWGTGGINIDDSRIPFDMSDTNPATNPLYRQENNYKMPEKGQESKGSVSFTSSKNEIHQQGRFPANIILSEEAAENLNEHTGPLKGDSPNRKPRNGGHREKYVGTDNNDKKQDVISDKTFTDSHLGASKFFYVAKPSKKEKDFGMTGEEKSTRKWRDNQGMKLTGSGNPRKETGKNIHPTVKPIKLMEYLIKLVTPKGGTVLDPFMGSGTTGIGALTNGFNFIGIEMGQEYMDIAEQRIDAWTKNIQTKMDI